MIFIICLILAVISIILAYVFDQNNNNLAAVFASIVAFPSAAATIIMLIALILTYVSCPNTEARWQERYTSLNTRIEEHMYYPWERIELIKEVQKWNEDFSAEEKAHGNFWVGIFNPESINGLNKIDLTKIK